MKQAKNKPSGRELQKSATGIQGLDEITNGGFPEGRPTLISGNAGCGKTLLAMEFLVRGATLYNEPGVFIAFEETEEELITNVASLGFNLSKLIAEKKLYIDHVHVERSEIEETGEYDLEGLFVRLNYAIDSIGAKRVVIDTIESLFSALPNHFILRAEIRRLFRWLKSKKVTAIITGERGDDTLTRQGLEEYVSDCVVLLDHRIYEQTSVRRMRIVKYRGTLHGTNEYPFLINGNGISVMPITSVGLTHMVSSERISTGIKGLDEMLGNKGYYQGSSILVSGTAGTGKSSIAAQFAVASCKRGERVIYFSLEESPAQIIRNMRSIGIDLEPLIQNGTLLFHAMRPTFTGLEMHLATIMDSINEFNPVSVILDPLTSFLSTQNNSVEAKLLAIRLIDYLKMNQITGFFTTLTDIMELERTDIYISSIIDTWIHVKSIEKEGERNRVLYVLKSRGMIHSNQVREFLMTDNGIILENVYIGPSGVLTGTSRIIQEAKDTEQLLHQQLIIDQHKSDIDRKRQNLEAGIASLKAEFEADKSLLLNQIVMEESNLKNMIKNQDEIAISRKANPGKKSKKL